jgi:hypothetical protein
MRGASLFFVTIILVTSTGREAANAYISETMRQFDAQAPYSYIALLFMVVLTLVFRLMMSIPRSQRPAVCFVFRETRFGPVYTGEQVVVQRSGWVSRMLAFFRRYRMA